MLAALRLIPRRASGQATGAAEDAERRAAELREVHGGQQSGMDDDERVQVRKAAASAHEASMWSDDVHGLDPFAEE